MPATGSSGCALKESKPPPSQIFKSGSLQSPIHTSKTSTLFSKSGSSSVLFSSESIMTVNLYRPSSVSEGTTYCHSILSASGGASAGGGLIKSKVKGEGSKKFVASSSIGSK